MLEVGTNDFYGIDIIQVPFGMAYAIKA